MGLEHLKILKISFCRIPWKCFGHLTNLTDFYLWKCKKVDDFGVFKGLVNLIYLNLIHCGLKEMPKNAFVNQKQLLETLDLEFNKLEYLNCEAFNGLETLKVLNISSNRLSKIDLVKLDEILVRLKSLKKLYLSENGIVNLETILNKFSNLKIIY